MGNRPLITATPAMREFLERKLERGFVRPTREYSAGEAVKVSPGRINGSPVMPSEREIDAAIEHGRFEAEEELDPPAPSHGFHMRGNMVHVWVDHEGRHSCGVLRKYWRKTDHTCWKGYRHKQHRCGAPRGSRGK